MNVLLILISLFAMPEQDSDPVNLQLSDLRWEKRVILLFAGDASNEQYQQQIDILKNVDDGLNDRKLVIITLPASQTARYQERAISRESRQRIRRDFGPEEEDRFTFVLIGLDGGEKLRSEEVVPADDLFSRIDRMPMRARELRNRN